jgi:hypothetical protein
MSSCTQFNVSGPSPKTYGMCFGNPADWNKFGNPGNCWGRCDRACATRLYATLNTSQHVVQCYCCEVYIPALVVACPAQ